MAKRWEPGRYEAPKTPQEVHTLNLYVPTHMTDAEFEGLKARFTAAQGGPIRPLYITSTVEIHPRPWWRRARLRVGYALARCYLRVRLVTDKALVDRWCIHIKTYGHDLYLWARGKTDPWWRVRVTLLEREDF